MVNEALAALDRKFAALYSPIGRPSIPPEKLLRAKLLQAFCSIRSERLLMERLEYDLLFRWFVAIGVDDAAWDHLVFSKNRDPLTTSRQVPGGTAGAAKVKKLLSSDHVCRRHADRAWTSMKSVKPRTAPASCRCKATGAMPKRTSMARRARTTPMLRTPIRTPGSTARAKVRRRSYASSAQGDGHAERVAALHVIQHRADRRTAITLGADKTYDADDFVNELRSLNMTPHVAQNASGRSSAIDGRTTRHGGYAVSQRIGKRIGEAFGWIKTVAGQEKTSFRGRNRVAWAFSIAATAYNLVRPQPIAETG